MTVEDNSPPPPPTSTEKSIPFSIPNKVPIKLDLKKYNYNSLSFFSLIHLGSLGLKSHVETDTASTNPEWCQLDDLIKMWILRSLCDSLQEQAVTTPGNVKALWDHLKNLFHDNKDARAINLDNELRSIKIGKMTVNEYCTKIHDMTNRLKNLDCEVSKKNTMIFVVNGLDSCFATLAKIIRHREPFPTFETIRNMLLLKESSFNDDSTSTTFESSSSSLTILMASSSSNTKGYINTQSNLKTSLNYVIIFLKGHANLGTGAQQLPTSPPGIPSLIEPQPAQTHFMVTRSQSDIVKLIERLSLHTSSLSPIPKYPFIALKDPNWCNAMYDEYNALVKNGTRVLVPKQSNVNLIPSMCLFKHKFHADDTLSHYKARLVSNGSNQQHDVDFDDTFSLVVKSATIRTVLSLDVSRQWPIHQLDVKNALLNGDLSETRFAGYATRAGFSPSRCDSSLFIYTQGSHVTYLLIYVDDVILTTSSLVLLRQIVDSLHKEFDMTDLRTLNYYFGIPVVRHPTGSTSGYCVFLGDNLLSWSTKRQHTISCSSDVAECQGVANVVAETACLRNLLRELHSPLLTATLVYCDNVSAIYMSANPFQHQQTKHIEIDIHFVRDMVKAGHVRVLHVPSLFQYADIFTKGLPSALFEDFRSSLSVCPPSAQTVKAY
nr:hybrid signal transduction histidine kinase M [Tanacetum cinerariifolium]